MEKYEEGKLKAQQSAENCKKVQQSMAERRSVPKQIMSSLISSTRELLFISLALWAADLKGTMS